MNASSKHVITLLLFKWFDVALVGAYTLVSRLLSARSGVYGSALSQLFYKEPSEIYKKEALQQLTKKTVLFTSIYFVDLVSKNTVTVFCVCNLHFAMSILILSV